MARQALDACAVYGTEVHSYVGARKANVHREMVTFHTYDYLQLYSLDLTLTPPTTYRCLSNCLNLTAYQEQRMTSPRAVMGAFM